MVTQVVLISIADRLALFDRVLNTHVVTRFRPYPVRTRGTPVRAAAVVWPDAIPSVLSGVYWGSEG